ncbi:MAG: ATP-binding cassette domain-containing protein [Bacillota bacterium]
MIEVRKLTKRFKEFTAVDEVSFTVGKGEFFGFLGPNGAGKTTTIKVLATLLRPSGGTARVNGYDVVREPAAVRRSIGMVFQDPSLDDRLTAQENLQLHAMLYGVARRETGPRILELLELVGLADRRNDLVRRFSGGMKRRLEIARGLLHRPGVLFLDEPTVGLDPQTRRYIWEYIGKIRRTEGATVFLTTHYIEEAEACDRIGIIDQGRIVALDSPAALKATVETDLITVETRDPEGALRSIKEQLGLEAVLQGDRVIQVPATNGAGEELIPRLAAAVPGLTALGISKPTLEDVFLTLTGRAIREEAPDSLERMRQTRRARARKGR